jgi:predicted MFS family arabinose efflux permease
MVYALLPFFQTGLGVDLNSISFAISLRSGMGILSPVLATIADQRGRRAGMLFGLSLFTGGMVFVVIWPSFPAFVLALVLGMLGNLVFIPAVQAYLGDWVPYQQRGRALALTEFGWSLSFIIGVPLVGFAMQRGGWQAPFPFLAGLGLLAMLILAAVIPRQEKGGGSSHPVTQNLRRVLLFSPALAGLALGISASGANEMVNLVFSKWVVDSFGVEIAALAVATAIIGVSELGGEALVALLADRLGKEKSVAAGLVLNSLAVLLLPALGHSLAGALAGLFFFYITFEFLLVSSLPMMTEVVPAARATMMATYIACTAAGRALADLVAFPIYTSTWLPFAFSGITSTALVATALNFLALFALYLLHRMRHSAGALALD